MKHFFSEKICENPCLIVKADFRKAHLVQSNFQGASLQGADFSDAYLLKTSFAGVNLRGARFSAEYPYDCVGALLRTFQQSNAPKKNVRYLIQELSRGNFE